MAITDIIIPFTLALVMFGIGMNISFKDFKRVFKYPKAGIVGLVCQMIVLPVVAFIVAWLLPVDPLYKVGFVLIAACPGGTASNLVTYLLKGNNALSVSLTSVNSLLVLISIPFIINLGTTIFLEEGQMVSLGVFETLQNVFLTTVIPVFLGVLVNEYYQNIADRFKKPMKYVLPTLLAVSFAVVIFLGEKGQRIELSAFLSLVPYALLLNVASMAAGFFIAKYFKVSSRNSFTISIEVGLQNSALAIFVASVLMNEPKIAQIAVIYGSFSFFSTLGMAWLLKKLVR